MWIVVVIGVGLLALAHTAPAPFILDKMSGDRAVWHMPRSSPPTVYLTFDDGPNPLWTPALLDRLRDEHVRATFFLIDAHITTETAPIVRRMSNEGHAIGLHTGTRRPMVKRPRDLADELRRAAGRISSITGREPCRLFRPHAGWRSATMYEGLQQADYRLAGWSWGMWDWNWWRQPQADAVARRLARKASAGDIIVIHDGHHKNPRADRRRTPEIVGLLVPALRARGFVFGTLCE
jgi:peptidoglycan/xylan/chitin deacetylase (PgdA/CDA1 family)